ncbi:hypothetical protein [Actinomycetospora chiangmaiensis]|uniref:hypothetical protein n=1 Tax=Actinomycetospora chiangmaiensis TaxID=402650 RepID=UPI000381D1B4|nr:hypothetical protein [Actinomycetospora chiangmaiensis]
MLLYEGQQAAAGLEQTQAVLAASQMMLEKTAKDLGVRPDAPTPGTSQPARPSTPLIASMTRGDALATLRNFGEARTGQGDEFLESEYLEGAFLYATGAARVGINARGEDDDWTLSIFSAARARLRPSLELYRFVSRWRTTAGAGAPSEVESDGGAAIMCERLFRGSQFANDVTGWRMMTSTIDLVGAAATAIARYPP